MVTKFVQDTPTPESEKDTNQLEDNASDIELEMDEPVKIDGTSQKKVHQFYFVKLQPYEDRNENVKSRIEETEKLIAKINEEELLIIQKFKERSSDRYRLYSSQRCGKWCGRVFRFNFDPMTWMMDDLQEAIDKLSFAKNPNQRTAINSCSARELTNFMQHKPNNWAAKKQLSREMDEGQKRGAVGSLFTVEEISRFFSGLYHQIEGQSSNKVKNAIFKEIKQFEHVANKAIANANLKGKKVNPLGSRKAIQDQIRLMNKILEQLKKERFEETAELQVVDKDLNFLRKKRSDLRQRRVEAEQHIQNIIRQQNEVKSRYYRYVSVLSTAEELARKKEVTSLEELSLREIDTFMSHWNKSKVFRHDYKKSISRSLNHREMSSDGRIRNPDEEPLKPALKQLQRFPY